MPDIFVHDRLKKCCRDTLQDLDAKKKRARFEGGLLATPSLAEAYSQKTAPEVRATLPASNAAKVPPKDELARVTLATCRVVCEKHAAVHEGAGEAVEAALWKEMAAGLDSAVPAPLAVATSAAGGTSGMDVDKAVTHLDDKANAKSQGKCGRYVQNAIRAGGVEFEGANAKDMGPGLEEAGFVSVATQADTGFAPQAGDVVVFDAVDGHPYGHTAMYDGSQWVSDFRQRSIFVNDAYRSGDYTIYRP